MPSEVDIEEFDQILTDRQEDTKKGGVDVYITKGVEQLFSDYQEASLQNT